MDINNGIYAGGNVTIINGDGTRFILIHEIRQMIWKMRIPEHKLITLFFHLSETEISIKNLGSADSFFIKEIYDFTKEIMELYQRKHGGNILKNLLSHIM